MGDADAVRGAVHDDQNGPRHTRGPWYVSVAKLICAHGETFEATVVADLSPSSCAVNRDANARLIAAAPDLLALVELIAGNRVMWSDGLNDLRLDMRAVIAKATGA